MGAVVLRVRAELRSRLRSWLGLALLVGLIAGLVIAAAAGARRTDSAYERFLVHQRAADVFVDNYPDPGVTTVDPEAVERLPQVASSARAVFIFVAETGALVPVDAGLGRDINRPKVVDGRLPAPDRIEEIAVGFERAKQLGWRVGTRVPLIEPQFAAEAARYGVRNIRLRVVGTIAVPGDFPPLDTGSPSIFLTPAFHSAYADTLLQEGEGVGQAVLARLERGSADLPAFRAAVERLARGKPVSTVAQAEQKTNVQRTLDLQAAALWIFAAVLALTGLVVLSQTLARQAFLDADEHSTLHAIGMTRRQLRAVGVLRAVVIGIIGAVLAVALAVALSPLAPIGELARTAEPDPGISLDATVLALGGAATVLLTVLLAAPAVWIAARGAPAPRADAGAGSGVARLISGLGARSSVLTGVRMALEPGRGRNAVPVRTAIVGVTVGVAGFAAALTFSASSTHLLDTPRLYGWNWDLAVTNYGDGPDLARAGRRALARDPAVEQVSAVDQGSLYVEGRRVDAMAIDPIRGSVLPPVIEGRAPAETGEILLGAKTMRTLGLEIGDTVRVRTGARTARVRIVGQGVFAALFSNTARLGQGAGLLYRDLRRLNPEEHAGAALLRLAPGADRPALMRRLERRQLGELYVLPIQKPLDIVDFGRVRGLPLVLTGLLGTLAAATLAHVLSSAVRRRRRDLAVLKAVGFVRAQIRTVVVAQSLTYAAFALLVGLPLGVAAGRFGWNLFAEEQGIVAEVTVPLPALLLGVPATALLAGALALFPARRAAATRPAAALRAE